MTTQVILIQVISRCLQSYMLRGIAPSAHGDFLALASHTDYMRLNCRKARAICGEPHSTAAGDSD